jgi:hypothetical protein
MVLHLASPTRRVHIETMPVHLRIEPYGLWVNNRFVPADAVLGFDAVDPRRGQTTAAIILGSLALAGAAITALVWAIAPRCACDDDD